MIDIFEMTTEKDSAGQLKNKQERLSRTIENNSNSYNNFYKKITFPVERMRNKNYLHIQNDSQKRQRSPI